MLNFECNLNGRNKMQTHHCTIHAYAIRFMKVITHYGSHCDRRAACSVKQTVRSLAPSSYSPPIPPQSQKLDKSINKFLYLRRSEFAHTHAFFSLCASGKILSAATTCRDKYSHITAQNVEWQFIILLLIRGPFKWPSREESLKSAQIG